MAGSSLQVGVVIERRDAESEWIDHTWHAVGALPGAAEINEWVELGAGDSWVRYHAATLPLEVFVGETEGYKYNLSLEPPVVFIVLDPEPEDPDVAIEANLLSVCPYEAQDYLDGSEVLVETVPMPPAIAAWLAEFVETHHVDKPFKKRKRVPHPDKQGAPNELILPPARAGRRGPGKGDNA